MIGSLNVQSRDVTIVGAGVSGLLAAYYLDRAGYRVTVLEAHEQGGGLISTRVTPFGLAEAAAHSIPASPIVQELFSDLGLSLLPLNLESKARFIYRNGRPRRFPLGIWETLKTFVRAYFVLAPQKTDPESLTLAQWARRFLGDSALKYLMTPFVRGIYGALPDEISVSAAFPALCVPHGHSLLSFFLAKKLRKKNPPSAISRSIPQLGRGAMSAPENGMQSLTDALELRLRQRLGDRFRTQTAVEDLSTHLGSPNLMLCVPASEAAKLLHSQEPELAEMLAQVRYSPLTTATIFLNREALAKVPQGVGVLMPEGEGRKCLGVLYNSSSFSGRVTSDSVVSVTMMLDFSISALDLPSVICEELNSLFGFEGEPLHTVVKRWERAVPKYDLHLLQTWKRAQETWCSKPGRLIFGNYAGQVSIRGMAELASQLAAHSAPQITH